MSTSVLAAPDAPNEGTRAAGRLILENAMIIDGTGAPTYGPATVVVSGGRIVEIVSPGNAIANASKDLSAESHRSGEDDVVLDLSGKYLLPGFVDAHAHIGTIEQVEGSDYVFKLWLAHGVTTVREAGSLGSGLDFVVSEQKRSDRNEIVAPRLIPYVVFGQDYPGGIVTDEDVETWVADVASRGAAGIKFFGAPPNIFKKALEEAAKHGLGSMCHHAQSDVARVNALTTAEWGLGSVEHAYGLPEAMFVDKRSQVYPADYNYVNEHDRFSHLGRLWAQAAEPGSAEWTALIDQLISLGTTLVPTFVAYLASRDVEHAFGRSWHQDYTTARLSRFFTPGNGNHGSYFFDWGTEEEAAWRENYRLWMAFVRDFHVKGGRVCVGSDAGFIYNVFGFAFVEEMELFREAGLPPLEIIRAATLSGAELLGLDDEIGSIEVGKSADFVVVGENPLANFKVLYGTGHKKYDDAGVLRRVGGIELTVKAGVVYDSAALLKSVRDFVAQERGGAGAEMFS